MASLLVGRGVEVAVLRGLIADLPNRSAAVMVRGEAGIGKTFLVRSVLEGHSGGGVRVLRGACAPMSGSTAYSGLDAALGGVVGGAVSAETFPSAAAGRAWAIERLREGLDDRSPEGTVLLVEDVHWADRSTLDFLSYTTRNLPDRRLLVVVTWRDEDGGPEHRSWLAEQLRNPEVVDLTLRRLTLDETAEQLSRLKPVLSGAQVAVVYERSAGNPYLSAELAGGGSTVSRSLRQVLSARLQDLSPTARVVVAATGTLARPLTDEDMAAAVGGDTGAVREVCDSGLVIRDVARGSTARHPVLAEVGYEQLLSAERRGLHAKLGKHLEQQLTDNASASAMAEVAEQYRRADDREATLRWSVRAARAAEAAYAPAEAGHWYAVASSVRNLAASPDDEVPGTLELAEMAASLLGGVGQHERAFAVLEDPLAHPDAPDAVVVRALVTRGWLRVAVGDTDGALNDLARAEQLTEPADEPTLARVLCERGMALSTCTRDTEAEPVTQRALDIARRLGDRRTICRCQLVLGIIASRQQRYDECRGCLDEVLSLAREIAQPEELALAGLSL
ncbi:MAG: AAA family ATPase, partial [Kribbellaceae bacterium]